MTYVLTETLTSSYKKKMLLKDFGLEQADEWYKI